MSDLDLGWAWFDTSSSSTDHEQSPTDRDLAQLFARCFCGEQGVEVLKHLKSITHSRVLGPTASDALLRHMEGQRQLVAYIISLVEHGRGHGQDRDFSSKQNDSAIMENTDD
jgi:hypothetical protein